MQPGQAFGPFTLEEKLGAGAMGVVWRAAYTKTGQRVAIKIMMPGLDDHNANAQDRFEREAEILKQFSHPNIVRLFGVGKFQGRRYYAMEYIEGETLDRVIARRDRMTWEEVVALGKQLCAALQHAHERGIIHRDLKPSNLMVLRDGTVKLTDFGIAKDMDRTQLTSENCTVGTASYMSPEQCRGERDLTHKSDLYSLGVVFYELATGRKPFEAENAMEMFMQHVSGKFERPSRRALELPIWFDNLICQLLEKKPEQRPRDAAMVGDVLGTIQEKVEAQQSAGVEVATRKRAERRRGGAVRTEADREVLRTLAGRPKRKEPVVHFYQRWWFVAGGVVLVLGGIGTILFLALWLWPRSSVDKLYARAKPLMESPNPDEDWPRAIDPDGGPLIQFERYHADEKGERADQMRQWLGAARKREAEKLVRKYVRFKKEKRPLQVQAQGEVQEEAFAAAWAEEEGDIARAAQRWAKVKELGGKSGWGLLAEARQQQIAALAAEERRLAKHLDDLRDLDYKPSLSPEQRELAQALRYERFGDQFRAYQEFEKLRQKYEKEPDSAFWYLFAAKKANELKPDPGTGDDDDKRNTLIARRLADAQEKKRGQYYADARLTFLDIVALYGSDKRLKDDNKLKKLVDEATQGLEDLKKLLQSGSGGS
jgi:serine/threonine-protein kinase